jgi:hypothetical protein
VVPDLGELIDAIGLRLAALDINSRQAAQTTLQQFREVGAQSNEIVSAFHGQDEWADGIERTLSWHLTMVQRMSRQIGADRRH